MKKALVAICLFVFYGIGSPALAASTTKEVIPVLSGKIINSKGIGTPYAAVALVAAVNNGFKVVSIASCGEDGKFSFTKLSSGKYSLEISCVGYTPAKYGIEVKENSTDLGTFSIIEGVELKDAVVSTSRVLVKTKVDRLVYDVEKDPDAAKSNTLQILDKVPFVQVDKMTNQIRVMGQTDGFTITINGKESLLMSETNQYVAKMLQAGQLKQIELITSPDGKYSNKTAVVNIITKSALPDGLVGELNVSTNTDNSLGSGAQLTSKIKRLIYNISYNYGYSDSYGSKSESNRIDYTNNDYKFSNIYTRISPGASKHQTIGLKASYDISKFDLLTVKFNSTLDKNNNENIASHSVYTNSVNVITREFNTDNPGKSNKENYVGSINYQRSFKSNPQKLFTATFNLDNRKDGKKYDLITEALTGYTDNHDQTRNDLENFEQTAAVDFYNTISGNQAYYITAKYIKRDYRSDSWLTDMDADPELSARVDALDYTQQVGSLQGNYSFKTKTLMIMGNAAFEYTDNDINYGVSNTSLRKKNKMLIASITTSYRPIAKNMFLLTLSREYFRPDITYLNPYENKSIAGQISKGNPELENQKSYFASLIYRFFLQKKLSFSAISSMRYSGNSVQKYSYMDNDGILVNTYDNIGKDKMALFSIGVDYNPLSWIRMSLSGRIARRTFEYPGNKNAFWDPYNVFQVTSELWKGAHFDTRLMLSSSDWNNPNIQSTKKHLIVDGTFNFSQKIGKRFQIGIGAQNPWQKYKKGIVEQRSSDYYNYHENITLGRTFSIFATYNFGQFKDAVKSASRAVSNSDRTKQ